MRVSCLFALITLLCAPVTAMAETLWNVEALTPDGTSLEIKAFDKAGRAHEVKAIAEDGDLHLLDIKAFVDGRRLPVKLLPGDDALVPVKAIAEDGTILDVKAVAIDGRELDVKGVGRAGNIFHIKAIGPGDVLFAVKALSPQGFLFDVKGVKLSGERIEGRTNGVDFVANIKALPQVTGDVDGDPLWFVRAVTPEGHLLAVQAFDRTGKRFDLRVIEDGGDVHVMDVKAFVGGKRLPVKLLAADGPPFALKAIGDGGALYDIAAVGPKGEKLDVKGVGRAGNIIDIKAFGPAGAIYGVKALSPRGLLHDIKGIKLTNDRVEAQVNGVDVAAHVKALPQVPVAAP
jgi:hypothetical protein